MFDTVVLNQGNNFNEASSMFRVPVDGVYEFSVSGMVHAIGGFSTMASACNVHITINGIKGQPMYIVDYDVGLTGGRWDIGMMVFVAELNAYDQVQIQSVRGNDDGDCSIKADTSSPFIFKGSLLN